LIKFKYLIKKNKKGCSRLYDHLNPDTLPGHLKFL